MGMK
ncbi:hypothetical protein ZOSMA_117G00600, partial [Zostera marina]|jgi:hypothetical protein